MQTNESSPSLLSTLASSSLQNSLYNSLFFSLKYLALCFQPSTSNPSLQLLPVFLQLCFSCSPSFYQLPPLSSLKFFSSCSPKIHIRKALPYLFSILLLFLINFSYTFSTHSTAHLFLA